MKYDYAQLKHMLSVMQFTFKSIEIGPLNEALLCILRKQLN